MLEVSVSLVLCKLFVNVVFMILMETWPNCPKALAPVVATSPRQP